MYRYCADIGVFLLNPPGHGNVLELPPAVLASPDARQHVE